jgi:16S rRNA (guanine966-N2)-methyltransferase
MFSHRTIVSMVLRVIAGEFRRRHLKTPPGIGTRPYTDRVRQMVFDRLVDEVEDARVADVFSGVGTMGLESISRGAASCVFFEFDREIAEFLKQNVATIAPDARTICWRTDVRRTSFRPNGGADCLPYTLIFFDPPYADVPMLEAGKPLADCLRRLAREDISDPSASLILRTPERTDFVAVGGWHIAERWDISTMTIWKLRKDQEPIEDAGREIALEVNITSEDAQKDPPEDDECLIRS